MAKDVYHEIVKRALEKDGWLITHDPFTLKIQRFNSFSGIGSRKGFCRKRD